MRMNEFLWLFSQNAPADGHDRKPAATGDSLAMPFLLGCVALVAAIRFGGFDATMAFAGLVVRALG
jgi:hypothetical protein